VATRVIRQEPSATVDAYEAVFTALAHPIRRRILVTLHFEGGSMTAGEIARMFDQAWPTTTRHMQALEGAGLLHHERHGRNRVYRLDRGRLELVGDWLAWFSKTPHISRHGRHK